MRILIVSTLKRKVTPEITASRSRIIFELSKGLAEKGHEVSLLGTGDSQIPSVKIIPVIEKGWVDLPPVENEFFREIATMVQLAKKIVSLQDSFDIIHNHLYPEFFTPLIESELKKPMVTTVHVQATDFIDETLSLFKKTKFISISNAHKSLFKKTQFYKVVYNGIDTDLYSFNEKKEDYLLWIGRLSKAKNIDGSFMDPKGIKWAIQLAKETGQKLILTGNVEDMEFYNRDVKPHLNDKIQWFGPVSQEQILTKQQVVELMQKAKAFLMTINWDEPFGLVMAEAMSCGTPVIGFNRGSIPELVVDGKTGFVVAPDQGIDGLKNALDEIESIKSQDCRDHVVRNFSVRSMVENYENVYNEILKAG
jgi:glycosyltransferase involved in cell wall biosynthesis